MQSRWFFFPLMACALFLVCCEDDQSPKNGGLPHIDRIEDLIEHSRSDKASKEIRSAYIDSAQTLLMGLPNDTLKNSTAVKIASSYYGIDRFEDYNGLSRKILQWSLKVRDSAGRARALENIGTYFSDANQSDSAYYYLYNANKLYTLTGNQYRAGRSLLKMGLIQTDRGDFIGAEAATVRAISHFSALDNVEYLSFAYNNLGIIYGETGQYKNALEDHQRSLAYKRMIKNNELSEVTTLNNIGLVKLEMKDYKGAIEYYEKALSIDSLYYKDAKTYAMLLNNLAHANFLNGNTNGLPEGYFMPLRIRDSIGHIAGVVSSNLDLSSYYKSVGEFDLAKAGALKAAELSKVQGYDDELLKALLLLSGVTEAGEALGYANRYIRVNDGLQKEERKFRNQFARIRFDTDQLEKENEQISRQMEWLMVILIGLAFMGLLSLVIFRERSRNKQLLHDQKQRKLNEEIYSLMLSQQLKLNEGKQLERKRFSEELHDGILSQLFGVRLSLDSLGLDGGEEMGKMKQYVDELRKIEGEVRQISHDLSADQFSSDLGYTEVIEELIIKQCGVHSIDYEFHSDEGINWEGVPNRTKMHLYRIIQESLQNVNKYAKADNVRVSFETRDGEVELAIEDNGIGFKVDKKKRGIGIRNITSRAREVDGRVELKSEKGRGTRISVSFPSFSESVVNSTILDYETTGS